jgi:hypothetical protein
MQMHYKHKYFWFDICMCRSNIYIIEATHADVKPKVLMFVVHLHDITIRALTREEL